MSEQNEARDAARVNLWDKFIEDQPPLTESVYEYDRTFNLGFDAGYSAATANHAAEIERLRAALEHYADEDTDLTTNSIKDITAELERLKAQLSSGRGRMEVNMSEEARKAVVFICEYSEQNPVYCQQCGGHEHLCRKPLSDRWCEYANHLLAHGNDITALSMRTNLLAEMNAHAEHTGAIIKAAQKLFERQHSLWKTHWEMAQPRGVCGMTVHACDVCEEIHLFHEELAELKAALEGK